LRRDGIRGSFAPVAVLKFYTIILAIFGFDGALLTFLAYAYHAKRFESHRISLKESMKIPDAARLKNIAFIAVLSVMTVFGMTFLLYQRALHWGPVTIRIAWEILAILLVYDFAYYWLHRAMHHKKLMKYCHAVHHEVHNPTAMESFYLHPIELFAGLALLCSCVWALGPVHVYSFAAVFFIHSTLNITVHSGVDSKRWFLFPIDHLTRKHYIHHAGNYDNNYASLTPFWDMLFGTRG
jgi:sterol desaturase/sphingolipid hydroxylase (fatty acid hydroxylase superfamily)